MEYGTKHKSRDNWNREPKRTRSKKSKLDKYLHKSLADFLTDTPRSKKEYFVETCSSDLPQTLKATFCDIIIFYHPCDRAEVEELKGYLKENSDAVVELYSKNLVPVENIDNDLPQYNCPFHFKYKKKRFLAACGFVYLTANFKEHLWPELSHAKYFSRAIYDLKMIPVLPRSKENLEFQIPMGLNQLRPLNHYLKDDDLYQSKLKNLVEEKAKLRREMEEKQFRAQLEFLYRKFTPLENSSDSSDYSSDDENVTSKYQVKRERDGSNCNRHSSDSDCCSKDSGFLSAKLPSNNGHLSYDSSSMMEPHAFQTHAHGVYSTLHNSEFSTPIEHESLGLQSNPSFGRQSDSNYPQSYGNQIHPSLQPRGVNTSNFPQRHHSKPVQYPVSREVSLTDSHNSSLHSGPQPVNSLNLDHMAFHHPSHQSMNSFRSNSSHGNVTSPYSVNVGGPIPLSRPLVFPNQVQSHTSVSGSSRDSDGTEYYSSSSTYSQSTSSYGSHHPQLSPGSESYSSTYSSQENSSLPVYSEAQHTNVKNIDQGPGVHVPYQGHHYSHDLRPSPVPQTQQDHSRGKKGSKGHRSRKKKNTIIINGADVVQIGDKTSVVTTPQVTQAEEKQGEVTFASMTSASSSLTQDGEITSPPLQNIQSDHSNNKDNLMPQRDNVMAKGSDQSIPQTPYRIQQLTDHPPQRTGPPPQVKGTHIKGERSAKSTKSDSDYRYQLQMNELKPVETSIVEDMASMNLLDTERKKQIPEKQKPVAKVAPIAASFNNGYDGSQSEGKNPNHYQNDLLYPGQMPQGMYFTSLTVSASEEEETNVKQMQSDETSLKRP